MPSLAQLTNQTHHCRKEQIWHTFFWRNRSARSFVYNFFRSKSNNKNHVIANRV